MFYTLPIHCIYMYSITSFYLCKDYQYSVLININVNVLNIVEKTDKTIDLSL